MVGACLFEGGDAMWRWWLKWVLGLLLALMTSAQAADVRVLRIATGELPPYATESRADQGIALNVVRRAFELAGYKVEFSFMPWSRALVETRAGRWDGTAYWGRTEERERDFWHSDNVLTEQWVFIHRKSIDLDWKTLDDLKPFLLAVIRDYTYTPELRAKVSSGELRADPTPDDLAALRKLIAGRVDVAPMERNVACDLLGRHFSEGEVARLHALQS